jgi:hypothetical protein
MWIKLIDNSGEVPVEYPILESEDIINIDYNIRVGGKASVQVVKKGYSAANPETNLESIITPIYQKPITVELYSLDTLLKSDTGVIVHYVMGNSYQHPDEIVERIQIDLDRQQLV